MSIPVRIIYTDSHDEQHTIEAEVQRINFDGIITAIKPELSKYLPSCVNIHLEGESIRYNDNNTIASFILTQDNSFIVGTVYTKLR